MQYITSFRVSTRICASTTALFTSPQHEQLTNVYINIPRLRYYCHSMPYLHTSNRTKSYLPHPSPRRHSHPPQQRSHQISLYHSSIRALFPSPVPIILDSFIHSCVHQSTIVPELSSTWRYALHPTSVVSLFHVVLSFSIVQIEARNPRLSYVRTTGAHQRDVTDVLAMSASSSELRRDPQRVTVRSSPDDRTPRKEASLSPRLGHRQNL